MAGGEVIGAAIGITLIILVAYVVVGSILFASDVAVYSQKDAAIQSEIKANTRMTIIDKRIEGSFVNFTLENTGGEIISDFNHMEIVSSTNCIPEPYISNFSRNENPDPWSSWHISRISVGTSPENQHLGMLDPGERMAVWFPVFLCTPSTSVYFTVVTNKGSMIASTVSTP